ncbi:ferritin family protein [Niallia taxi]|uniref:ferritin family protein n=1 Tax=Niallia taxi TaxID=2499688 RepID=UPI0015F68C44|nr:ferritin family protein [Niallia taxi]MCM3215155.1 ferritin-like domain-containing protein [Niallia taxi]MDK8639456.1 ferritin family protein [Niallia taxi]MED4037513.1 ferritin family protein [Niallia taxi]MED4055958.1 ferritin family protein [Niallia taxi]MED4117954.1 ferritin family protein [Niallia taxi]
MNNLNHYYDLYQQRAKELAAQIEKAIDGEFAAIHCYKKLETLAPTKRERQIISEIRKDEINHYNVFSSIYTQLTGQKHSAVITETCPNNYHSGIDFAFHDEQETVDFYLTIADSTSNDFIKESFKRAAMDEQNHAVWFLYFLKTQR